MPREAFQTTLLRALLASFALLLAAGPATAQDRLPDLFSWAAESSSRGPLMYDGVFDTDTIANRALYRFHVSIPNIGDGPFELREETVDLPGGDREQTVYQRIYQQDGSIREVELGKFLNPANTFGHLWLEGLAQYNLREAIDNGTETPDVGPLVSSNDKTSMGVVDSMPYDVSLPGAPATGVYNSAEAEILGISIGHADFYGRNLPGQWVDATGLEDGQYWLEVIIDPYQRVVEKDATNNTTHVLVDLEVPDPQIHPGDYNQDGIVDLADYTVWRDTLGRQVDPGTAADGDGDGLVNMADHGVWVAHFGESAPPVQSGSATAPEPPAWLLLAACLALGGRALAAGLRPRQTVPFAPRPTVAVLWRDAKPAPAARRSGRESGSRHRGPSRSSRRDC